MNESLVIVGGLAATAALILYLRRTPSSGGGQHGKPPPPKCQRYYYEENVGSQYYCGPGVLPAMLPAPNSPMWKAGTPATISDYPEGAQSVASPDYIYSGQSYWLRNGGRPALAVLK